MIYKAVLTSGVGLLLAVSATAQTNPLPVKKSKNTGLFNITQIGYNAGVGQATYRSDVVLDYRGSVNRFRTTFGYFLNPAVSVGLGFGLDGYHEPSYNTAPLVADVRYYFQPTGNSLFVTGNVGYALKLGAGFERGVTTGLHVGYRVIAGRSTNLLFSVGPEAQQIQDARINVVGPGSFEQIASTIWLKSISFNAGFLF